MHGWHGNCLVSSVDPFPANNRWTLPALAMSRRFLAKGPGASPECQREAARNFRLIRGHWSFPILMNFAGIKFNTTALVVLNDCPFFVRFSGWDFVIMISFKSPLDLTRSWSRSTSSQWSFDQSLGCWDLWTSADWWVERSKGSEGDFGERTWLVTHWSNFAT